MEQYLKLYKTSNEYYEDSNKPVIPHIIDLVSFTPEPPVVNPCENDMMCPEVIPNIAMVSSEGGTINVHYIETECWKLKNIIVLDSSCVCDGNTISVGVNPSTNERTISVKYIFINISTRIECQKYVTIIQERRVSPCEIDTMCPVVSPENIYVDYKGEEIRLNYDLGECWRLKDVIDSSECSYYDRTRTLFVYQNDEDREREFNVKFVFANKSTGLECQSVVNVIQYANPVIDPFNGHEYVDLGLPSGTLWAKMNIGANTEEDYGNYYQWGAIEPYENKSQYYTGQTLTRERDIVSVNMGGSWIIPSKEDFEELIANTNYSKQIYTYNVNSVTYNKYAKKFTNKNDSTKYIIIPYGGFYRDGGNINRESCSYLWTSEKFVAFDSCNDSSINNNFGIQYGLPVRGVVKL